MQLTYLSISILDSRYVGVAERSFHKPQDKGTLANSARPKHDDTIVITLLWHPDICRPDDVSPRLSGSFE